MCPSRVSVGTYVYTSRVSVGTYVYTSRVSVGTYVYVSRVSVGTYVYLARVSVDARGFVGLLRACSLPRLYILVRPFSILFVGY